MIPQWGKGLISGIGQGLGNQEEQAFNQYLQSIQANVPNTLQSEPFYPKNPLLGIGLAIANGLAPGVMDSFNQGRSAVLSQKMQQAQMEQRNREIALANAEKVASLRYGRSAAKSKEWKDRLSASSTSDNRFELEKLKQEGMNQRAGMGFGKAALSGFLKMAQSDDPAAAQIGFNQVKGILDKEGIDTSNMTAESMLAAANALTPQGQAAIARAKTEDALRQGKVDKVAAEIKSIFAGTKLKESQKKLVEEKVKYYPLEYQARVANIYSQIAKRKETGTGGGANSAKALETDLRDIGRLKNIAEEALKTLRVWNPAMNAYEYRDYIPAIGGSSTNPGLQSGALLQEIEGYNNQIKELAQKGIDARKGKTPTVSPSEKARLRSTYHY